MSQSLRRVALLFGLAALYYFAAKLGLRFAYINSSVTTIWPPAGIALAAFVLRRSSGRARHVIWRRLRPRRCLLRHIGARRVWLRRNACHALSQQSGIAAILARDGEPDVSE